MEKGLMKTPLNSWHKEHGGQMVEFAGWEMPVVYKRGIIEEHLSTRRYGGLFDISHMGRFLIGGKEAIPFLQHVLTNNALALDPGMAQYTLIPNERGGAVDDAYLYRLNEDDPTAPSGYLLVVNASNKEKDWNWFIEQKRNFSNLILEDKTDEIGMIALQGPKSKELLEKVLAGSPSKLPDPWRNRLKVCEMDGSFITVPRTGYAGEPLCFELFAPKENMNLIWEHLVAIGESLGIIPVGLGARDTLRLEAGLPLYGHELGLDTQGKEIPIYAVSSIARLATSFSSLKGTFIGREALKDQFEELQVRENHGLLPPKKSNWFRRGFNQLQSLDKGLADKATKFWQMDTQLET
jgi:aminomethyltransferase